MPKTYDREVRMAERLIKRYGQAATWRGLVDGPPADPSKPWKPGPAVPTNVAVDIAFFPEDERNFRVQQYVRDTAIPETFEVGYMKGNVSFAPKVKDKIIRGAIEYTIWYIDNLRPNGTEILYTVGLKL